MEDGGQRELMHGFEQTCSTQTIRSIWTSYDLLVVLVESRTLVVHSMLLRLLGPCGKMRKDAKKCSKH